MTYVAACLLVYLTHAVLSAPGLRNRLVAQIGARVYRASYSVISIFALLWFVRAYRLTGIEGWLYSPVPGITWIALAVLPFAIFLVVARFGTPYGELAKPVAARGIYRVTRFPGSWGVLIWALVHLAGTGDIKRVMAFGTFALIAVTALVKNEYVLRRERGAEARHFLETTSLVPFGAAADGRQQISLKEIGREIGWKMPLVSIFLFVLFVILHPWLFGVGPLSVWS